MRRPDRTGIQWIVAPTQLDQPQEPSHLDTSMMTRSCSAMVSCIRRIPPAWDPEHPGVVEVVDRLARQLPVAFGLLRTVPQRRP